MKHEFEKFIAVVELGNFTKAAEQLRVSQPALSYAIKDLEKEVGHQLLVRGGTKVTLTEAGKRVYDAAKDMRLELDNLSARLSESEGKDVEKVRLGMIDSIGTLFFKQQMLKNVKRLEVAVNSSYELLKDVVRDKLDIAFVTKQVKFNGEELILQTIGNEPFIMVSHPDFQDEILKQIKDKKLTNFLAYNERSNTYNLITRTLKGYGIKIMPIAYSTDPDLLKSMALAGRGSTLLPYRMVKEQIESGDLVNYGVVFDREIQVAYRTGKYLNSALVSTIDSVKDLLKTEQKEVERARNKAK